MEGPSHPRKYLICVSRFSSSVLGGFHLATPPLLQKEDTEQEAGESGDAASVLRAAKRRVDQDDVPAALSLLSQVTYSERILTGQGWLVIWFGSVGTKTLMILPPLLRVSGPASRTGTDGDG